MRRLRGGSGRILSFPGVTLAGFTPASVGQLDREGPLSHRDRPLSTCSFLLYM